MKIPVVLLIILLLLALLLILVLLPFTFRVMIHVDILHNHLLFSIRVLGLKVFSGSIKIHGNLIYITSKKGEKALKIIAPPTDEDAIASYMPPYFPQITLHKLNFYAEIGKSDDAYFSAIGLGIIKSLFLSLAGVLKSTYPKAEIDYGFEGLFNIDHLQITLNCILSATFADIIYTAVRTLMYHKAMVRKGAKKNAKRKRASD